jgi:hypothetical protein
MAKRLMANVFSDVPLIKVFPPLYYVEDCDKCDSYQVSVYEQMATRHENTVFVYSCCNRCGFMRHRDTREPTKQERVRLKLARGRHGLSFNFYVRAYSFCRFIRHDPNNIGVVRTGYKADPQKFVKSEDVTVKKLTKGKR